MFEINHSAKNDTNISGSRHTTSNTTRIMMNDNFHCFIIYWLV